MKEELKKLIKKQNKEFDNTFLSTLPVSAKDIKTFIAKVRKETAEYEKDRIKRKVEEWRRGFSMTCAESDIYEKAHQQILKVLNNL